MYKFDKQILKDGFGWGFLLWLAGYILGIVLFMVVPASLIGWVIMPVGVALTLWVLLKKIKHSTFGYYGELAVIWTIIAVFADYFFLVRIFKPADGYYKPDVYIYYSLTCLLPILVGWSKTRHGKSSE
jgi:hypothetical protein